MNSRKILAASAFLAIAGTAYSQITLTNLGISAPPTSLDGYGMTAAPADPRPLFTDVFDVDLGGGKSLDFDIGMNHRRIGSGWATWSHGYTGDVYFTNGLAEVNISFPDDQVQAFIIYVEPNVFAEFLFEIEGTSSSGAALSDNFSAQGTSGAVGYGISVPAGAHIDSVRVTNTDGAASGFAVGEFFTNGDGGPGPGGDLDILVFDSNSINSYALQAATNLGDATRAGTADFNSLLTSQDWDVVALDMPSTTLTDFNPLINYINDGNKVIVSTWGDTGFGGWTQLLAPMGATGGASFSMQSNPSVTSTGTAEADEIFDGITLPITSFNNFWGSDGVKAVLAGGSVSVAQQGGTGDPIVWVGNDASTIGSWVIDEMAQGDQAIALWENYFTFLAGDTGCRADLDGDGELTIFDFLEFQNLFDSGDLAADFDGDGALTIFDFLAFQNEFDAGCE